MEQYPALSPAAWVWAPTRGHLRGWGSRGDEGQGCRRNPGAGGQCRGARGGGLLARGLVVHNFVPQTFCLSLRAASADGGSGRRGGHAGLREPTKGRPPEKREGGAPPCPRTTGFTRGRAAGSRGGGEGKSGGAQDPRGERRGRAGEARAAGQPPRVVPVPCPAIKRLTALTPPWP